MCTIFFQNFWKLKKFSNPLQFSVQKPPKMPRGFLFPYRKAQVDPNGLPRETPKSGFFLETGSIRIKHSPHWSGIGLPAEQVTWGDSRLADSGPESGADFTRTVSYTRRRHFGPPYRNQKIWTIHPHSLVTSQSRFPRDRNRYVTKRYLQYVFECQHVWDTSRYRKSLGHVICLCSELSMRDTTESEG